MRLRAAASLSVLVLIAGLSGCTVGTHETSASIAQAGATLHGRVHGGQQPVVGAAIYLYAAGTGGDGTAAASLLQAGAATTKDASGNYYASSDNNGGFSISGDYACPAQPAEVYLVALGGNPGLSIGKNAGLSEMAALGLCSSLNSSTDVLLNEVTTVGSMAALYPYMTSYSSMGYGSSDAVAFTTAFSEVSEFTNIASGSAPGPSLPAGYYASTYEINTLGNVLAACINSAGGVAGDNTPCGNLYLLTKPAGTAAATDTIGALIDLLKNPTQNTAALFGLTGSLVPFQPSLSAAPSSWTLPIVVVPGTPVFSLAPGSYAGTQILGISDSDPTAVIYYSTNGSSPSSSSTVYTGPLTISSTEAVQAVAIESARVASAAASGVYTITSSLPQQAQAPSFSPPAGTYTSAQTVTISSATAGAAIYYTMDGTTPNSASTLYTGAVTVSVSGTLKAMAVLTGYTDSAVATASYTIGGYGVISTIAGDGIYGYSGDNGPAISAQLYSPSGVTLDASGNLYIADYLNSRIRFVNTSGIITTFAGNGIGGYTGDTGAATAAELRDPLNTIFDTSGNLYIADTNNYVVRKVTPAGIISTYAGNNIRAYTGDNGPATSASLNHPAAFAFDSFGNLYIVDANAQVIRKVNAAGTITTVAGNGTFGFSGDGGPATSAQLGEPFGIAVDTVGNLYIGDSENNRIRKVTPGGVISTIAGSGAYGGYGNGGYSGDGGPATSAQLNAPYGLALDSTGNLYVADTLNSVIRKINPSGVISTVAGNGALAFGGDGGLATSAELNQATALTLDSAGNLYIADYNNQRIRKVTFQATAPGLGQTAEPVLSLPAGSYTAGQTLTLSDDTAGAVIYYTTNGTTPTTSSAVYSGPLTVSATETFEAIAVAPNRANSVIASAKYTVAAGPPAPTFTPAAGSYGSPVTVTLGATGATGFYYTINGTTPTPSSYYGYISSTGSITVSASETLKAIASSSSGVYSLPGSASYTITYIAAAPVFSLAAGTYTSAQSLTLATTTPGASIYYTTDGSTPTTASNLYTGAITLSTSETVSAIAVASGYTASTVASNAYMIDAQSVISTFAGTGTGGFTADNVQASTSELYNPRTVAVDSVGNVYIADATNNRVRMVSVSGVITTVAGTGTSGYNGDNIPATTATLSNPYGVAVDSSNNLYIADYGNNRIRKVSAGVITTVAGNGTAGYNGDGIAATAAELYLPEAITFDAAGNLYINDYQNERIRKVSGGTITTIAGTGSIGYNGDNIAATSATLFFPTGVAVDAIGNVYIADRVNNRIRKVSGGIITTYAGTGTSGTGADGGLATATNINQPSGVSVDTSGNVYFADGGSRIRKVNTLGIISTVAGTSTSGFGGDGGLATLGELSGITNLAIATNGNLYIADTGNQRIRLVSYQSAAPGLGQVDVPTFTPAGGTYTAPISVTISDDVTGTSIYYTQDGTIPTTASTLYTAPIPLSVTQTIQAIAVLAGRPNSSVSGVSYTMNLITQTPTFSPAAGTYAQTQTITISTTTPNAVIHYTTDGTTATASSAVYGGPLTVSSTQTISAMATSSLYPNSVVATALYTINTTLGTITTIAGTGTAGYNGDSIAAITAQINNESTVTLDGLGNIYIADGSNNRVRKINTSGIITTIAGTGTPSYTGDNGLATSANLNNPNGVAVDSSGNVYIADRNNNVIRKINTSGIITTIAGTGSAGYNGDSIAATSAQLNNPRYLALDAANNLYISDSYNNRVRKINASGIITTVAGNGTAGFVDNVTATSGEINTACGIAIDSAGNLYIGDVNNQRVREVVNGIITTIAGTGTVTSTGDGGAATSATVEYPEGIALDAYGNVYVASYGAYTIRKFLPGGSITTVAGGGSSLLDGVAATYAGLSTDFGVAVDAVGSIYIPDPYRLRKVTYGTPSVQLPSPVFSLPAGAYSSGAILTLSDSVSAADIYYTTDGSTPTTASTPYTGAITLTASKTVSAIAVDSGYISSAVATATYTILQPAATPTISPAGGTNSATVTVSMADTTPGAVIHYTTDGSTPTASSPVYSAPFSVTSSSTVNAVAVATGFSTSSIASATYNLVAATPAITPAAGAYNTTITVSMTDTTPGAVIHYTTDGSTPTATSAVYSTPFVLTTSGTTVNAIAIATGYANSSVASSTYYLDVAPTYFSPLPSIYTSTQFVTIATPTPGATVYYTLDGSTPTTSSAVYTTPIGVSGNTTLKSMAIRSGYVTSSVSTGTYQVSVANAGDRLLEVGAATGSGPDVGADCSMTLTINGTAVPALCTSAATNRYYDTLIRLCNVPANTAVSVSWTIPTSTLTPYDEFEADALGFTVFGGNYIIPVTTGAGGYIIAHDDGFPLYGTNPQTFFPSLVTDTSQQNLVGYQPTCTVIPGLTQ